MVSCRPCAARLIERHADGSHHRRSPVSKYADHLPLYRQAQIYARQGIGWTTLAAGVATLHGTCVRCRSSCW